MKISAFCLTTNAFKMQFPFIESIKSFLPIVDELIVVDGGSTDGTIRAIQKIDDEKIRIVCDKDTKWEDDWEYWRMGHNFNRGFNECSGDIVIKFDVDYVAHDSCYELGENGHSFRDDCEHILKTGKKTLTFSRRNFIVIDRYFFKSRKTLGIVKSKFEGLNVKVCYGLDVKKWAWGFEPIIVKFKENGIWFGEMIRTGHNAYTPSIDIFNYDDVFMTRDTMRKYRARHFRAVFKQQTKKYKYIPKPTPDCTPEEYEKDKDIAWKWYEDYRINYFETRNQIPLRLFEHPKIMWKRITALKKTQQGYDYWGQLKYKTNYYKLYET